jgi:hypothetical protein
MSKAQTDIRSTSYDAATANAVGYVGTIEDALAQIRAEDDVPAKNRARAELLHFLGADKSVTELSGIQAPPDHMPGVYVFPLNEEEDWSVHYGEPERVESAEPGFYTLSYALKHFPKAFEVLPDSPEGVGRRLESLTATQLGAYLSHRATRTVRESLALAEALT